MKNKILLFLIAFFNFHSLFASTGLMLEWEEVKGARAYHLQIRDSNQKIVFDEKVGKPFFELKNLEEGTYEHRIGVYNKFGKIVTYTEWESFSVLKVLPPEVIEPKELELEESTEVKKFSITGKNFKKKMKVSLFPSQGNNFPIQEKKIISESEFQIALNMKDYPVGTYNLVLENSPNKKTEIKNFLKVKPKKEQVAETIEPPPTKKEPEKFEEKPEFEEPYPYWKEAWQSTYFPGLGQWNKGHKFKAVGFGILLMGGVVYYFGTVRDFQSAQKKYDETVLRSGLLSSTLPSSSRLGFLTLLANNENAFQVANYKADLTRQAIIGIGVIYTLNILDALLWKKDNVKKEEEISLFPKLFFYSYKDFYSNQFSTEYQFHWNFRF